MNKPLYPTKHQTSLARSFGVLPTNAKTVALNVSVCSIFYFRMILRITILIYLVLTVVGAFEILSLIMRDIDSRNVFSFAKTLFLTLTTGAMVLLHNQVLMILGHGYKSKDAQLVIDRYSDFQDCKGTIAVLKSMYFLLFALAGALLWMLWGFYGTPFYNGLFAEQWEVLKGTLETFSLISKSPLSEPSSNSYKKMIPFLWIISSGLMVIMLFSALGWLQAFIAKIRVVKASLNKDMI